MTWIRFHIEKICKIKRFFLLMNDWCEVSENISNFVLYFSWTVVYMYIYYICRRGKRRLGYISYLHLEGEGEERIAETNKYIYIYIQLLISRLWTEKRAKERRRGGRGRKEEGDSEQYSIREEIWTISSRFFCLDKTSWTYSIDFLESIDFLDITIFCLEQTSWTYSTDFLDI